ncbi:MAG: PAS domain S-box protein [Proteobacteria bacterium]|nr:MAG: PAS domain S-box protein [Pseudomonadota bacterium]
MTINTVLLLSGRPGGNGEDARMVEKYLSDFTIMRAADAVELVQCLRENRCGCVLIGQLAARESIRDMIKVVRESGSQLPIIVIAESSDETNIVEALRLGATDWVSESHFGRLNAAVATALAQGAVAAHAHAIRPQNSAVDMPMDVGFTSAFNDSATRAEPESARQRNYANSVAAERLANIGSWDWNIIDNSVHWSDQLYLIFGYEPGAVNATLERWYQCIHPDDVAIVEAALEQGIRDPTQNFACQYRIRRPDGALRIINSSAQIYRDDAGRACRMRGALQDITDKSKLEAELKRVKSIHARAEAIGKVGVWDWDLASKPQQIYWSETLYELYGLSPKGHKPSVESWLATIHVADRDRIAAKFDNFLKDHAPIDVEYLITLPDGATRVAHARGDFTFDAQGHAIRMTGVVCDVTDLRHAEAVLKSQKAPLDLAGDAIFIYDPVDFKFFYVNRQAEIGTGYSRDELYQMTPLDLTPDLERHVLRAEVKRMMECPDAPTIAASVYRRKDGGLVPLELQVRYVEPAGDSPRLIAIARDISQRLKMERERDAAESRWKFALEGAGAGVWDRNFETDEVYYSPNWKSMLGYGVDEVEPHIDAWRRLIGSSELAQVDADFQRYLAGESEQYYAECRVRCKDGSSKWMAIQGIVVERHSNGKPIRMIGTQTDITERKHIEAALIFAKEEAEQANLVKSQFLSRVSHELRTPLHSIIGFNQLLQIEGDLGDKETAFVKEIRTASDHLLALIDDVLDLSRIESQEVEWHIKDVDLVEIIQECVALSSPNRQVNKVSIELDFDDKERVWAKADRVRLKQILLNLLSNALKYNKPDGRVTICLDQPAYDTVRVVVEDTGIGIARENIDRVFAPFSRVVGEHGVVDGIGIGLAIARSLVDGMGGTLSVESEPGIGSRFSVELPAGEGVFSRRSVATVDSGDDSATSQLSDVQALLYIDDNQANLSLVSGIVRMLRPHWDLTTTLDPHDGISIALKGNYDVILIDMQFEGTDGYEVLNKIREGDNTATTPIVAISANAMQIDIDRALISGFMRYITKPFEINEFLQVLDDIFAK